MYRLMMIDDEYAIHLSMRTLIESSGLALEIIGEAEDGAEAMDMVQDAVPDIIVTDICMPEMDGLEFIRQVRELHRHIHFIILSGHDNFEFARQALRYGVSDFLLKPLDPKQFQQTLANACRELDHRTERFSKQVKWTLAQERDRKKLFEHIWALQEAEALAKAQEIIGHFEANRPAEIGCASLSDMLMQDLLQELETRGLTPPEDLHEQEWPADEPSCYHLLLCRISELMEVIKSMRNYGALHNVQKAKRYIEEHYVREDLSLQEVADSLGMSVTSLSRTFKSETSTNFVKYLVRIRMEKAKELLADTNMSAQETAYSVGFADYVHFSKTFKKFHGLTPSDFRKQSKAMK
ncbi:hypothetical protein JCM10914A_30490 [Paenibacillus sp. JCM 10914]|uniref:response regulator n=1 Tax=Paenibacillus sp. JCM 10914 TaxID=1236974 RepID=UPI0003CC9B5D|nr:response regulator [Paenibacillus sp. JCM 10914]GAE07186.1 response regulator receiver [Paenibacillus sp. JCM 10914]